MRENYLMKCFAVIGICFVIDSTISYFLPYNYTKTSMTLIPYIGLMMFSLLVDSFEPPQNYFFATVCGVYYSIVYSNSLAIYILIYCLIAFIRYYLLKIESFSPIESSLYCISTIFASEVVVYCLMWMTNTTNLLITQFVFLRLLPTLVMNLIFSFVVTWICKYIRVEVEQ